MNNKMDDGSSCAGEIKEVVGHGEEEEVCFVIVVLSNDGRWQEVLGAEEGAVEFFSKRHGSSREPRFGISQLKS